jgi:hypothetical protein
MGGGFDFGRNINNFGTHRSIFIFLFSYQWKAQEDNKWFHYTGAKGKAEWTKYCSNGDSPPVENDGGSGTRGGHWDEACFDNMMMTGWLNSGRDNPLSVLSVAALEDIGFTVSYDTATAANLLSSPCCFPRSRRNLRGVDRELRPLRKSAKNKMSADLYELAADQAAKELQAARRNAPSPSSLPEGVSYIGGDFISIIAIDEDGLIKEETFEWSQVRHRI